MDYQVQFINIVPKMVRFNLEGTSIGSKTEGRGIKSSDCLTY